MKKLILIFFLFSFSINGFGQKDIDILPSQNETKMVNDTLKKKLKDRNVRTYVIEYDFQTGLFPNRKKLKPRVDVPVVFKITNINRLAYTVKIESKDSVIGFSDLSGMEMLLTKKEVDEIVENVKKTETNPPLQNNNLPVKGSDFLTSENGKTKEVPAEIVNEINQTNSKLLEQLNTKINEIIKGTYELSTKIDNDTLKISANLVEKFPYHFKAQNDLTELYILILVKHQTIISLWNEYRQARTYINDPLLTEKNIADIKDSLSIAQKKFSDNKNVLNDFNLLINRFQNLYNSMKSNPEITQQANYGGSIKLFSIVDNLNIEVKSVKQQIDAVKFDVIKDNVNQIYSLFFLENEKYPLFEYVSDPIQPFQDVAIFKVKVQKNDKDASLFYNERDFSYKEFTRHGIRFDLNIGIAGSFYNKDNFYDIKADSNGVRRITNADKSGFSPSFVGFFTTSYRSATHWTGGLSVGLGISADDGTITLENFFIGPSLIVGRYERVNLTTGVSLKNLRKLDNGFKEGQEVANATIIEGVTTKSYEPGFFIALTYNLTKGVKNNVKQIKNFL